MYVCGVYHWGLTMKTETLASLQWREYIVGDFFIEVTKDGEVGDRELIQRMVRQKVTTP